jgi:hypothetical protein
VEPRSRVGQVSAYNKGCTRRLAEHDDFLYMKSPSDARPVAGVGYNEASLTGERPPLSQCGIAARCGGWLSWPSLRR